MSAVLCGSAPSPRWSPAARGQPGLPRHKESANTAKLAVVPDLLVFAVAGVILADTP